MSETGHKRSARREGSHKAAAHRDTAHRDAVEALPVSDLGCLLVLTQLLAAPLKTATAIEDLRRAAAEIGWQPVSDVLRTASERCLARGHASIDGPQVILTPAGRHWLLTAMTRNFADLPRAGADLLLACQLAALSQLGQRERRGILAAVMAARPEQSLADQSLAACDPACAATLQPWQNWQAARRAADLACVETVTAVTKAGSGR
jgi:hypothetical protein